MFHLDLPRLRKGARVLNDVPQFPDIPGIIISIEGIESMP